MDTGPFPHAPSGGPAAPVPGRNTDAWLAAEDMHAIAALVRSEAACLPGVEAPELRWWMDAFDRELVCPLAASGICGVPRCASNDHTGCFAAGGQLHRDGDEAALVLSSSWQPDREIGALLVFRTGRDFDAAPLLAWVREIGAYVGNTLEKVRQQRAMQRLTQAERLQRALFAISDMAGSDMDMPMLLRGLHEIVGTLMYAENFLIALYDEKDDGIRIIYFVDTAEEEWAGIGVAEPMDSIKYSLTWYILREGRPLMGPTEGLHEKVSGPLRVIGPHSKDWLGVPMTAGGTVRGALVVQSYIDSVRYTEADQAVLSFVGSHILTALDRKKAHDDLEYRVDLRTRELTAEIAERRRAERMQETLLDIVRLAQDAAGTEAFCRALHDVVGRWMDNTNMYVVLHEEGGEEYPFSTGRVLPRLEGSAIEYVMRSGMPLLASTADAAGRERMEGMLHAGEIDYIPEGLVSWIGVPLVSHGRTLGGLAVYSYSDEVHYGPRDLELLTFISWQIASSLELQHATTSLWQAYAELERRVEERTRELREQIAVREQVEEKLKHEVLHDSLTGLPNRAYLREQLERALAQHGRKPDARFAVLFMDLNRFKVINDSAGHLVGDALLVEVAQRFAACVRAGDMVARLGGDEFAVLMQDFEPPDAPVRLAQRLIDSLREPMHLHGKELFTSVSVGIVANGGRYGDADSLLRDADIAMYRAKANDREHFELFDEDLHQHALDLLETEGELRRAIAQREFEPYFQPIVRLQDRAVVGYEALVRWHHPLRGVLTPAAFLDVAEAGGMLEALDWQVYEKTCQSIPRLVLPGQYVNINVSPRHFRSGDIDVRLLALLQLHDVSTSQIRVEVTEGTLMENPAQVADILERLRKAGIMTALDDFGSGYSSLGYLHRLHLHTVKIDRSFVTGLAVEGGDVASAAVARAILMLAHTLELDVVAEGIETEVQREALIALGCRLGQGFLFARPQPLEVIVAARSQG
jgi:diguanylate cyclase (GGDEF)-like protein